MLKSKGTKTNCNGREEHCAAFFPVPQQTSPGPNSLAGVRMLLKIHVFL